MLHVAICDDEKDFVQHLTDLLNQYSRETGRDIKISPYYVHTGNEFLDIILKDKAAKAPGKAD